MPANDHELLAQIRKGDERAFGTLMRAYMGPLCAYIAFVTGSYDSAQDIVQDLWVRIWEIRAELEIKGTVRSYLYRAAHNRALTALKQDNNQRRMYSDAMDTDTAFSLNEGDRITESDSFRTALKKVVSNLRSPTREIFILRFVHNMEYGEIADTLGVPVTNVHMAVSRSTDKVLERLRRVV